MMRRWKLAFAVPITAVVALWGTAIATGSPATSAEASTAAKAVAPPKGKPEFSATFSGTRLNTKIWDTCYPEASQSGCTNFGNKEYQWYVPSQVKVSGGVLRLIARRVKTIGKSATGKRKVYECRSGMVTSYPGFHFKYGFVQIVADVPHSAGLWPALWMAPADGQYPPEADLLESWGADQETASFYHPVPAGAKQDRGLIPVKLTRGWQTYSLRWTHSKLTYYVGNKVVLTVKSKTPHLAMYLIANVAEYASPKAGRCNGQMLIRSVKVWKV